MKQLLCLSFILLTAIGCNNSPKETTKTEIAEVSTDTTKAIKKTQTDITKTFVLGKFDYKIDSTFTKVNIEHSTKEVYLKKETYNAFLKMLDSALADGIELKIISGTRNFNEQKAIWERKWKKYASLNPLERAKKILQYSSMPSTSRHHWGTDIDVNSLNNSYFNSGKGLAEYNWLKANANHFGFYQVYTEKTNSRTGYNFEKWHWSYLPLASQYLEYYNIYIKAQDISNFEGAEFSEKLHIINDYVNGISEIAKNYK